MPKHPNGEAGWIKPTLSPNVRAEQEDDPLRHWTEVRISWVQTVRKSDAITFAQEGYVDPDI